MPDRLMAFLALRLSWFKNTLVEGGPDDGHL